MRKNMHYMASLLSLVLLFAGCEKREPDFFDEEANGAYFDYGYATEFDKTLNFSEHIVGNPDVVNVPLKVKLLGYLQDEPRSLSVKTKPIEGYALPEVTIEEVTFAHREYEKEIEVKVKRPEYEDSVFAVCIYLDGSGDIGTAIDGKAEVNLYVTESYEKPVVWYSHVESFLGAWNKEKHIFLARYTGNNHFYNNLYDNGLGVHLYDSIVSLNVRAVNALLADDDSIGSEPKDAIAMAVDLPILREGDYPDYRIPYFWNDYQEYLDVFRASKFCRITMLMGGSNTKDIAALYASEEGKQKMEKEADNLHHSDVEYMLGAYYNDAMVVDSIADFRNYFWVAIRNGADYSTVPQPFWWLDPENIGTASIVKHYFGEYENKKYQFMLKTMMKNDGSEDFIAASLFPFVYDETAGTYAWDTSCFGKNKLAGEERLKECYRVIKAANNKRPKPARFDIPEVEL